MRAFSNQIIFLSVIFLFICSNAVPGKIPDSNIIAKFDDQHSITIKELNQYIQDLLYFKKYDKRADIYQNALNDMLTSQLIRIDFFNKGLDKDHNLIQGISRIINDELVLEYFENQYAGKYATEEHAKKVYMIMDKEVVYQLIELAKPGKSSKEFLDSLEQKALAIKSEIELGKDFGFLVKKYSQNQVSVMNNGFMPPIGWKQSLADPVGDIVFKLNKNEISVINSENAISVVKVVGINKIPVAPYDSVKNEIISELKSISNSKSHDDFDKDKKNLVDENSLKWNETAIKQIVQWSHIPNFYKSEYQNIINAAIDDGENTTILNYNNNGTVDYKEFMRLITEVLVLGDTIKIDENKIKDYILETVRTDMVIKKADSLDLRKNIFNAFTNNIVIKSQIVRLYNQVEVEAKIPEATDSALHDFFLENENSLYYNLEKRNLFIMVFPTKEEAEKAAAKINEGTPFEKITGSYLVKTYIKEKDGKITSFSPGEKLVYEKLAFEMKESEISGPLEYKDENNQPNYALMKCHKIRPEKQLTFNDVKDTIAEDYKAYHRKKIQQDLRKALKNKYNPVINEDVLASVISPQ